MKKLNKFFAILVSLAMMAMLCVTSVFAAPATGDEIGTDDANLVKYLEMADGVSTPDVTFTFTLTPVSDSAYDGTARMPAAATETLATSAMSETAAEDGNSLYGDINIIDALGGIAAFDHAGEYVYLVKETGSTFVNTDTEIMTLDEQAYLVHIYITNGDNGLEVDAVTAETAEPVVDPDTGEPTGEYEGTGEKVAPDTEDPTETDPTDEDDDDDTTDGEGTDEGTNGVELVGIVFDNNFQEIVEETVDPDPEDPTNGDYGALGVTKTVAGDYGDKTADFPFSITVNAPANWDAVENTDFGAETFTANIYNGETKGNDLTLTYGQAYTFNLKDGQALAIPALPAGATYTITEALTNDDYTPSYNWVDTTAAAAVAQPGTAGQALTISNGLIADDDEKNAAYYTNTFDDSSVTPTGILLNNLPFIVLALVAIGGLVAYVVIRRRDADEA